MRRGKFRVIPNPVKVLEKPLSWLFNDFFHSEKAGGVILLCCTVISIILANSAFQIPWVSFWNQEVFDHSLNHWINDGLMAVFFLMIGLELEREIYHGELSSFKRASLPFFGALGGMILPALIFTFFNFGKVTSGGTGIPMATDIAFAIGVLSLVGKKVPDSLKVFLVALAVMDDLGAILVIAIFYTKTISITYLAWSLAVFAILGILNRLKIMNLIPYLVGGVLMWYFMLKSGVHATITGVLLAFAIPFGDGSEKTPSYILQHFLHKPVAFVILPLFALANTTLQFQAGWYYALTEPLGLGVITGLSVGKPLGIVLFTFAGIMAGWCSLPHGLTWKHITGAGFLGGIGFTMSIFITLLAFDRPEFVEQSKMAIIVASLISGIIGLLWLSSLKSEQPADELIDGQMADKITD
jgi:NhaA family Na+:H+ antiporter